MSRHSVNKSRSTARRSTQRQATRRQLVDAALRVVAEHGFAGATTAAIAKASGKAHGTVFVHFRSREALVDEVVREIGDAISRRLAPAQGETPAVAEVLDAHLAALAEHEVLYARLLGEAATLPPAARARIFALQSGIAFRLRKAYERELAQGRVRRLDRTLLANTWIALTNHYLMHRDLFSPGASVVAARRRELKAYLLELIRA